MQNHGGLDHEAPLPCRCSLVRHKLPVQQQLPVCSTHLSSAGHHQACIVLNSRSHIMPGYCATKQVWHTIEGHASLMQHLRLRWSPRRRPHRHEWSSRQDSWQLHRLLRAQASQHLSPSSAHVPVQATLVLSAHRKVNNDHHDAAGPDTGKHCILQDLLLHRSRKVSGDTKSLTSSSC